MVTAEQRYKCITDSFLIDEFLIKEFFSGYIVNCVQHVRPTSPDMKLVDKKTVRSSSLEESILNVVAG
ncbi:hypothetical protein TNCV_256851 [Trichonephila clavipes]|nr:hypothetical protein TNCV_256851 [Trichonephila clavipes]